MDEIFVVVKDDDIGRIVLPELVTVAVEVSFDVTVAVVVVE